MSLRLQGMSLVMPFWGRTCFRQKWSCGFPYLLYKWSVAPSGMWSTSIFSGLAFCQFP